MLRKSEYIDTFYLLMLEEHNCLFYINFITCLKAEIWGHASKIDTLPTFTKSLKHDNIYKIMFMYYRRT